MLALISVKWVTAVLANTAAVCTKDTFWLFVEVKAEGEATPGGIFLLVCDSCFAVFGFSVGDMLEAPGEPALRIRVDVDLAHEVVGVLDIEGGHFSAPFCGGVGG
jgi:hypothetical protein